MAFTITKIDPKNKITISTVSSSYYVDFNMGTLYSNTVLLMASWTKDTCTTISITTQMSKDTVTEPDTDWRNAKFNKLSKVNSSGVIEEDVRYLTTAGNWRIIYNPIMGERHIRWIITPDVLSGKDELVVSAILNSSTGNN